MLNAVGGPPLSVRELAVSVWPVPGLSILRVANVATPLTAATGPPPVRVPPLGFVPMASVTFPVKPVTVFPAASSAATFTAGGSAAPAPALPGWPAQPRRGAGGGGGGGRRGAGGGP